MSLQGRLRICLFLQNPPCSVCLFCPQNKEGMPCLPGRGEDISSALFHGEGGAKGRASAPYSAPPGERPAPGGMRSSDEADVGPAGEIPASAKRHPMTRPLPKSSMGNSRAGGDARRPVYKEKRALFRASGRGTKKKVVPAEKMSPGGGERGRIPPLTGLFCAWLSCAFNILK